MKAALWLVLVTFGLSSCGGSIASADPATVDQVDTRSANLDSDTSAAADIKRITPGSEVLMDLELSLCGSSAGAYTYSRRYCRSDWDPGVSMDVGMSDEQLRELDADFDPARGRRPEGVEIVLLADGSEAVFLEDVFDFCEVEGIGRIPCDTSHHLSLTWVSPDGNPIALATEYVEGGISTVERDGLIAIANSIDPSNSAVGSPG